MNVHQQRQDIVLDLHSKQLVQRRNLFMRRRRSLLWNENVTCFYLRWGTLSATFLKLSHALIIHSASWGPSAASRALTHSHDMALSGISWRWWMRMEPVKDEDPREAAIRLLIPCATPNWMEVVQLQMEAKFHSAEENYFQETVSNSSF